MNKFNFHLSEKTRQVIIALVVAAAGIAMFSETYEVISPNIAGRETLPLASQGNNNQSKKITEAHWQGMEIIPLTWELAAKLGIPIDEKGVFVDEVTLASADSGLMAQDIVKSVNNIKVTNLDEFYIVTKKLRNHKTAVFEVKRGNGTMTIDLVADDELGFAQLESAPMILPGSVPPHRHRGPCTDCHAIGSAGHLAPDPDLITLPPPPISKKTTSPHRYRGKCKDCHAVR